MCMVIILGTGIAPYPPDLFFLDKSTIIAFCFWIVSSAFFNKANNYYIVYDLFIIGSFFIDFALWPNRIDVKVSDSL